MQKNDLIKLKHSIYRIIAIENDSLLVIDCIKRYMPQWISIPYEYEKITESELLKIANISIQDTKELSVEQNKIIYQRYSLIAPILAVVEDIHKRSEMIDFVSQKQKISKPTLRKFLTLYLAFQNINIFAIKQPFKSHKSLSGEQKIFRWALNKYYYTSHRNSLKTAYTLMLKNKFCDVDGKLFESYPLFHRFYYFYRKYNKIQNEIISRQGLTTYKRNYRPLLGNGVKQFCPTVGYGMLDSTICDIYLVNESGQLVGRPILTVCVDAYSTLCMGYSIGWEGGINSVAKLFQNIVADKVEHCRKFGIDIGVDDWNCKVLPQTIITDRGREYTGNTLENLTELGITITNLDGYRADLKGCVEKFFDIIQSLYKPYLKGKGVVDSDYGNRGVRDYRKDACLTLHQFEKIVLKCILYYNCQRVIEKLDCECIVKQSIKPYANEIWNHNYKNGNLIPVNADYLYKTLLPRTDARFTRHGLKVGKLHYKCLGFTEEYLRGDIATVAYDSSDCSFVYLIKNNQYIKFYLIESAFSGMPLTRVDEIIKQGSLIVKNEVANNLQAKINLANDIIAIADNGITQSSVVTKNVRKTRQIERMKKK